MARHDELLAGIYAALDGDQSRPAAAIRAVLLCHISQPAPDDEPEDGCATCVGTGIGLVDGFWVHCCCGCPICSCGQILCFDERMGSCETVDTLADELGVTADGGSVTSGA